MSLFKSDDNCSICQERAVKVESIKAEERVDPRSNINTRHEYTMRAVTDKEGDLLRLATALMTVRYSVLDKTLRVEVDGRAVTLSKEQFDDLRKVLYSLAFDPKFNGGVEAQV